MVFFREVRKYEATKLSLLQRQPKNSESKRMIKTNPFDLGWYWNIKQVLGSNFFLLFLPIPVVTSRTPMKPRTKV